MSFIGIGCSASLCENSIIFETFTPPERLVQA
jgi:hypothetical protein